MESKQFRVKSLTWLSKVGISVPERLPLIDDFSIRPKGDILDRIICLNAVAAAAYGFDKIRAYSWLSQEKMLEKLTESERSFLISDVGNVDIFKTQVEGMWALAWIVNIVQSLDFWSQCDPHFVAMLPDLKTAESSSKFRARTHLRNKTEIGFEVDLAYCLHWFLRDAEINGNKLPKGVINYLVMERRRALEWAIGNEVWDGVSLDT